MIFDNRNKAVDYLNSLFDKGKRVKVDVAKEKRSLNQNRLYWLWVACIEQETGNDKNNLHEFFTLEFLPLIQQMVFKKLIYKRTSTTTLDTKQFTEYLNKIQIFSSTELGLTLPNPEDVQFEHFYNHYKDYL
jgi:hypothetical protein